MQWTIVSCILLVSAHDIISMPQSKPALLSFKNLISSKLFGVDTIVVELPKIPENETSQIFAIEGYDDVFLKVVRKPKKEKINERPKIIIHEDPVTVKPEKANFGHFLGTNTHRETLLALDITKDLTKSGIVRSETEQDVQQVLTPIPYQNSYLQYSMQTGDLYAKHPIYIGTPIIGTEKFNAASRPIPLYPEDFPWVTTTEEKYGTFQNYPYSQNTGMRFGSPNNQKVIIITKTNEVPAKPPHIAMRLAEVYSIASNPYSIKPVQAGIPSVTTRKQIESEKHIKRPITAPSNYTIKNNNLFTTPNNLLSTPTSLPPTPKILPETPKYLPATSTSTPDPGHIDVDMRSSFPTSVDYYPFNNFDNLPDVPEFFKHSKLPFDVRNHLRNYEDIEKFNQFINGQLNKNSGKVFTSRPPAAHGGYDEVAGEEKNSVEENQIKPSDFVNKQLGKGDNDNYNGSALVVPVQNQAEINKTKPNKNFLRNFVYVPPSDVDVLPPITIKNNSDADIAPISKTSDVSDDSNRNKYDDYDNFNNDVDSDVIKDPVSITHTSDVIIPSEELEKQGKLKTNDQHTNIPSVTPVIEKKNTNTPSTATSSGAPFTGGVKTSTSKTKEIIE